MRMCQALVLVSLGVACSFFRRFGWLLIGLLFWAYILLHERVPAVAVLDVLALASPELDGHEWVIPLRPLLVQLALGAALMLAAYAMFLGAGDAVMRGLRRLSNTRVGGVVLLSASLLIGLVGLSLAYYAANAEQDGREEGGPRAVTVTYPGWSISRAGSRRYEFIYPTNFSSLALSLVAAADAVHEEVRRFFDAEPGEPIVVDASTTVPRHAGVAHWEKIRLDLAAAEDPAALESTLGHETAHVFLDRLSDSRLGQHADSTRFFHEGVATYVQCRLFDRSGRLARLRRVAAVMRARGEVHCEELVDHALLAAKRDRDLVYPLGEIFVAEMVARHGDAAIGRIARAMVRKGAPRGLSGLEFWRDAFQSCGYDFDGLLEAFYARLDDEVKRHRAFIDALPRVRGSVTCDAGWIEVRGLWHPVEPWHLVCRFRQEQDSPDRSYIDGIRMDSETFGVLRGSFPSATVWYQLGLCHPDGTTIFEPWTRIQLTD
jgi:hypothetical protein